MIRYRASWVVPITSQPIQDGWIDIDKGRVVAVGNPQNQEFLSHPDKEINLGSVAVLPGLVNAHTHLELSGLRGHVPPAPTMSDWVQVLLSRRSELCLDERSYATDGVREIREAGTALVGDISETLVSLKPLTLGPLAALVFREILGFDVKDPERFVREIVDTIRSHPSSEKLRISLAAHAPYSVSSEIFLAIKRAVERENFGHCSVHIAESKEELEFLRTGQGAWRDILKERGRRIEGWTAPNCGPVTYLDRVKWLDDSVIVVHGVHLTSAELDKLAERGVVLVTCPRSNAWTGSGTPPIEQFYASGIRVAVGTDSLASAPDLNLFNELLELRRLAPKVSASKLLKSATLLGAEALGFESDFGSIEPGKRAELIVVEIPEAMLDVEEYLVGGIKPTQIQWINETKVYV